MTTYRVATLATYILIDAENEQQARELGLPALQAEVHRQLGRDTSVTIRTVRPATPDEIELQRYHDEVLAHENSDS